MPCRLWPRSLGVILAAAALGCAGPSSPTAAPGAGATGPHGGPTVVLPDGLGVAEIVIEAPAKAAKVRSDRVVAYFLSGDGRSPASSSPSAARVVLDYPDRDSMAIELTPDPDKSGSIRFASRPGSYMVEPILGELTATWAGRDVSGRFASLR